MTSIIAPSIAIVELRAWLAAAERMLDDMTPADPRYAHGRAMWEPQHDAYMARVRAEGEPE